MNLSLFLPAEALAWLLKWGLFGVEVFLAFLILALLLRPFWLWYTGKSEILERLRRLDENNRKSLFELEMLNETLAIPVKKAAQRAKAAEAPEQAMVVSQETKDAFLKVLEKGRSKIFDQDKES